MHPLRVALSDPLLFKFVLVILGIVIFAVAWKTFFWMSNESRIKRRNETIRKHLDSRYSLAAQASSATHDACKPFFGDLFGPWRLRNEATGPPSVQLSAIASKIRVCDLIEYGNNETSNLYYAIAIIDLIKPLPEFMINRADLAPNWLRRVLQGAIPVDKRGSVELHIKPGHQVVESLWIKIADLLNSQSIFSRLNPLGPERC